MSKAFLSHIFKFTEEAEELAVQLQKILPEDTIFRSEYIDKGDNWRDALDRELEKAKCFILLYTCPELDWSWCFFEAGKFVSKGRKRRVWLAAQNY